MNDSFKESVRSELQEKKRLEFAKALAAITIDSMINSGKTSSSLGSFSKEDAVTYLENPVKYEKELRNMSKSLCCISPQYNRLVNYFPKLAVISPVVVPIVAKIGKSTGDKLNKDYEKALIQLDKMNIKHEFIKILTTIFREDIFYGYEFETNDSYYIKRMNPDYCKIATIEDGVYNYAFDFSYFDKDKEGTLIEGYPKEFKSMYNKYLKDKKENRWQIVDGSKSICIKLNEDLDYCIPIFANVFCDLYDINDYKMLQKARTEIDNYKLIGMEIPMRKDSDNLDDFLLGGDTVVSYYQRMLSALPQGVGAFISPMPFKEVNFAKQISDKNNVANAEQSYWNAAGVSDLLFGNGANTGGTLAYSIQTDEMLIFPVYRQLERWLNKRFKSNFGGKFKITLLDVTKFNEQKVIDNLLKAGQYGVPVKLHLSSALGVSPTDLPGLTLLENEALNLHENWIPLSSSHTATSDEEAGRPESDDTELTESGEKTRSNDSNSNKAV